MKYTLNHDLIITAVNAVLTADSTLAGATYVGYAPVCYTRRAPTGATGRYFVVDIAGPSPDENHIVIGELRIYYYLETMANGQIEASGDRVLSRCEELLGDYQLSVSGMTVQPLLSRGYDAPSVDEDDETRARGVLRMKVEAGPNP